MSQASRHNESFPKDMTASVRIVPGGGAPAIETRGVVYQRESMEHEIAGQARARAVYHQVLVPLRDLPTNLEATGLDGVRVEFDTMSFTVYRTETMYDPQRPDANGVMLILEQVDE